MTSPAGPSIPERTAFLPDRWDESLAGGLASEDLLLYRSNLLGADRRVTNFGGGNTSAKIHMPDPLTGERVEVLWVKGSGGDLATMRLDGFATLYQEKLEGLEHAYRRAADEDAVVGLYPHCVFGCNARAPSIDTALHALIARPHVDHVHPDAIISIAASVDGEKLTHEIFSGRVGWLPWARPGFHLALQLRTFVAHHPDAVGVILESHGLFTWGATSRECYSATIACINAAIGWLGNRNAADTGFGAESVPALPAAQRAEVALALMPCVRRLISDTTSKIGHFDDSPVVLKFVCSEALERLAAMGTSCPDHFLRTKIRPLVLRFDPAVESSETLLLRLPSAIDSYRSEYAAYYDRCRRPDSPPMRDPNAVVYLVPGVGMITFGVDKAAARVAAEFYTNAINVMRESSAISSYQGLPEQEAFDIEYWSLEEAKLQRMPRPKALAGRIALITGGAGGIGIASARRMLDDGACVIICDIDRDALQEAEALLRAGGPADALMGMWVDVTDEAAVAELFRETVARFGGLDICVSNAGIASAAPIEDTSLDLWNRNMDVLATGYFLVGREAMRLFKRQGLGGSIIFVGSKNALAASAGASAYSTAKAAEIHLSRCIALEGASIGVRANVVNPDAVIRGSRIWQGEWAEQRALQYQTSAGELESLYRERSLLRRSVFPADVAEAVAFFASDRSAKSTGNIINVDAGNAAAFTR